MTEVPEHLLKRSRERRAAIGGGGGGDAGAGSPPAAPGEDPGTGAAASAVESKEVVPAAAAATHAAVEEPPPPPPPPYVQAAEARPRIPRFALPVLAAIPLWALIYAGTLTAGGGADLDPELALGRDVYAANCAACHGAGGGGGTGRPLNEVLTVFPDPAAHVAWVVNGSPPAGEPYGEGRVSQSDGYGPMPGFGNSLSEEEIAAVVRYERVEFGGEDPAANEASGDPAADAESEGGNVGGGGESGNADNAAPTSEGEESEGGDPGVGGGATGTDADSTTDTGNGGEDVAGTEADDVGGE